MERSDVRKIVEALLYASDHPLTVDGIAQMISDVAGGMPVEELIQEIVADYAERRSPLELRFVAGGWQFATRREYGTWLRRLFKSRNTMTLSPSALETLAVVAYKQPITRAEIEDIRGVEASGVLDTIMERKLVKVVGRKESLGRPILYGTTAEFLRHFGLRHLSELPPIDDQMDGEAPAAEASAQDTPELPFSQTSDTDENSAGPGSPPVVSSAPEGSPPDNTSAGA